MKRVLPGIHPFFVMTILMAAESGTLAADDPPDKFQSYADVPGKDSAQSVCLSPMWRVGCWC